jgi:transcriptional regulator with GAF, ATPase, and Fis domain
MDAHSKETARNSIRTPREIRLALALLVLSTWLVFNTSSFASVSGETKRVLILYSFRYGLSANVLMDGNKITSRAIQTTMEEGMAHKIAFYSERMDVSALPENHYFEELRDEYRKKYAGQPIDLIIAVNYRALKFLIDHGEELWPNTPILFGGVEEGRREQLKQLRPNITGIFGNARFGDMLDTIFKIHPDTQQVTVIVGASKTERFIEARYRQASRKSVGRVDFTYLSDLGFNAILGRVADLPPNSIVLFLTLIQDGEGKPVPENALHLISRVSNAPVYGLFDVYVGHGIVGGSVYSIEDRGIRIGKVGVRILAGEKPKDIPIGAGQRHFSLYDWRQLQRWGIVERDLPPGSIVRYRDQTFYEIYKWYIWGGIFLILFEAVLIALLLINLSKRRRAERELQRAHRKLEERVTERTQQLKFEELISRISSEFINLPHDQIDNKIDTGLKLVAETLDFDRSLFHEFSEDKQLLHVTHYFLKPGIKRPPSTITSEAQPWFTKTILKGESVKTDYIYDLPDKAEREKKYLLKQDVKSGIAVPLMVEKEPIGALTFTTVFYERSWPDAEVQRLQLISEIFANALVRKQKEQKLRAAFSEVEQLKDRLQQENIYLKEEIELEHKHGEIIGKSPAINYVLRQAEQVAQTKSTVLLQGETGTGKELLARTIHNLSSRKDRAMVTVNCSALPPGLIESELFGREKGAYTGALTKQWGRFEIADGSTIFLDEVSELPLELQAKLLRVLQDAKFERLGGTETIEVDVRVIAATNRDLAKAVSEGSFREDLYYRLHVFPITVPTLHERQEDIPLLVWAFVRELEKTMGKRITTIKQARMEEMQRYPWPGNVRELRNVVERAMIVNKDRTLNLRVPETMMPEKIQDLSLDTIERNHITTILEKTGWRVKGNNGAAEILGLHPATLFSRIKKLGIKRTTNSDDISSRG